LDTKYADLGPICIIAWAQKEITKFVTEHEWTGLASKLPHSNCVKSDTTRVITCYKCGQEGHIKLKWNGNPKADADRTSEKDGDKGKRREQTTLAMWKNFCPDDITKPFIDDKKRNGCFA
jgi:hypothetical protein